MQYKCRSSLTLTGSTGPGLRGLFDAFGRNGMWLLKRATEHELSQLLVSITFTKGDTYEYLFFPRPNIFSFYYAYPINHE